jgi:hypothetical protein
MMWLNMQDNHSSKFVSHKYIRSIKIMVLHMRNMRSISVSIKSIVSGLDVLLLLFFDIGFGELD